MRAWRIAAVLLWAAGSVALSGDDFEPRGFAVMKREVRVPAGGTAALPRPKPWEVLPCDRVTDKGYSVVCRDGAGNPCMAFLPLRDRWGRPTAAAWIHDTSMAPHTVVVRTGVPLKPGRVVLERGHRYPVSEVKSNAYTVAFRFAGYALDIEVPGSDVEFEPPVPPETDPARLREKELARLLEQSAARQEELQARLARLREKGSRVESLLQRLTAAEIEQERLEAELTAAEHVYGAMIEFDPMSRIDVQAQKGRLADFIREQGRLSAGLRTARLESETLRDMHERIVEAEAETERLRTRARETRSEFEGRLYHLRDGAVTEERDAFRELLREANDELARIAEELKRHEALRDILVEFANQIEIVQARNAELAQILSGVTNEIWTLRQQVLEPDAAEPDAGTGTE